MIRLTMYKYLTMYKDAMDMALRAHRGQRDRSGKPYIAHPIRVSNMMETDEERVVALLHDVVEDSNIPIEEVTASFGPKVGEAVLALTRVDGEPYEEYIGRVLKNNLATRVKLGDLMDNLAPGRVDAIPQAQQDRYWEAFWRVAAEICLGKIPIGL